MPPPGRFSALETAESNVFVPATLEDPLQDCLAASNGKSGLADLDDCPKRADSVLAKPCRLDRFFEVTLAGIPVAPDFK